MTKLEDPYLRGAFWPLEQFVILKRPLSIRIFSVYQDHAEDLASLMKKFMLDAKVLSHKNGFVTYLQKAEDIMDFLLVIGAMNSKDTFEEVKIMRETRNDLNRANNAETANIARTISASMKTINNIIKIMDTVGLEIFTCGAAPNCPTPYCQSRLLYPANRRWYRTSSDQEWCQSSSQKNQ